MNRPSAFACLLAWASLASAAAAAPAPSARFTDPVHGFALAVPALGATGDVPVVQRLTVLGAPEGGFATNCNVQVQLAAMSIADYRDLSLRQFAAAGLEVHDHRERSVSGRPAVSFDYGGEVSGRRLRFASLAVAGEDRIWLLTCTALAERFAAHRAEFAEVLDSFTLIERAGAQ